MSVILLAGGSYYPSGWDDFRGLFDSVEAAVDVLIVTEHDWAEIVDYQTLERVERWERTYGRREKCPRCKGAGHYTEHDNRMTPDGLRVKAFAARCTVCNGNGGTGERSYQWEKKTA